MKCKKARMLCQELLDGELKEEKRQPLFAHLSVCSACRDFYKKEERLKRLVASLPTPRLSPYFNSLVISEIERRERAIRHPLPSFQLTKRVVFFILPLFLVFLLLSIQLGKPKEDSLFDTYRKTHLLYTLQNPLISGDSAVKMLLLSGQE